MNQLRLSLLILLSPALRAADFHKPGIVPGLQPSRAPLAALQAPPSGIVFPLSAALPPAQDILPTAATPSRPTAIEQVRAVYDALEAQLKAMEVELGQAHPVFEQVRADAMSSLSRIQAHWESGAIDPAREIRMHHGQESLPTATRPVRVGVYPVAADPFQWAHILIGLRAMAEFKLDKVVYVLAGDDPRKPNMTPVIYRHPMGQAVLAAFSPLFAYSPIAVGTNYDGETNIFRMLALNSAQAIEAFYLVGGDHYKLTDKNGNDDTLPKIEKKLARPDSGHNPALHKIEVVFVSRGDESQHVPTTLPVHFLSNVAFEASSTLVRQGNYALMPYAAYDWVRKHLPGHYGIGKGE